MIAGRYRPLSSALFLAGMGLLVGCPASVGPGDIREPTDSMDPADPIVDDPADATTDPGDNENDPPDSKLATFDDPDSDFSSQEVNDVEEEIVQFNTQRMSIIWALDESSHQEGMWVVDDNVLGNGDFQVRFGTRGGVRRAYFTETIPETVCDIEVVDGVLLIIPTNERVPQEE